MRWRLRKETEEFDLNICVFCGSSDGLRPVYRQAAHDLGLALAKKECGLVYGGASVGLMGGVADAVLNAGGKAIGVIPKKLVDKEVAHKYLSELHVVDTMHERKALMANLSDGFVAMPGGIGTLEETFEIWTWMQLGFHAKPLILLNVDGFFDGLLSFLDDMTAEKFLKPVHRQMVAVTSDPASIPDLVANAKTVYQDKWI